MSWLTNPKNNVAIATVVFCVGGFALLEVAPAWLAWGVAGLVAGLINLFAIAKEKRTFWRVLAMLSAESVGVGLVAYFISLLIR
jgi:hypothetical protein